MKVTIANQQLSTGLRRVLAAVSSRTTLPVLNNVLIECEEEKLLLTTTDLEVCIQTAMPAHITEPGATTLPAKKFAQIVGSLPEEDIVLETGEDQSTSISCQRSYFRILGLDPDEFPRDSDFVEDWSLNIVADELRKSLSKVSYASSVDEARHVLNGTLMSLRGGILTIAGTDGRRLALVEKSIVGGESLPDGDVILPPKVVGELERMLPGDTEVVVRLSESRAAFAFGGTLITSKLVEGTYPNYRQVVPAEFRHSVAIPRESFGAVLNRVAMVVSESSSSVRLRLDKAAMTVSATSAEFGEAREPLEVSYEGDPLEIAFNPLFFTEPLRHLECDQLIMQFNDEYSPVSLAGDEGFLYVVMPMRA